MTKDKKDDLQRIKDKFDLIDDDDNLFYGRKLDRSLILLKQIDRINFLAAVGDVTAYINSIQQLFYCLYPEVDKTALDEIEKEQRQYNEAVDKYTGDNMSDLNQIKSEHYGEKFRILNVLLRRKGLV